MAIGTWRDDRSYLWPIFVGRMATTAVRLSDQAICAELLAELGRLRTSSGAQLPETADGADAELRRDGEPWWVRHHSYSATSAISIWSADSYSGHTDIGYWSDLP